jgi:tRNA A37 methylthiotransferase MiaB
LLTCSRKSLYSTSYIKSFYSSTAASLKIPNDGKLLSDFMPKEKEQNGSDSSFRSKRRVIHQDDYDYPPDYLWQQIWQEFIHSCSSANTSYPSGISSTEKHVFSNQQSGDKSNCHSDASSGMRKLRILLEPYGCQMNMNDTDIVRQLLVQAGFDIIQSTEAAVLLPDVILLVTCAIRENAENKIFERIVQLRGNFKRHLVEKHPGMDPILKKLAKNTFMEARGPIIGILGCVAERLKGRLLGESTSSLKEKESQSSENSSETKIRGASSGHFPAATEESSRLAVQPLPIVDVVCGPDGYRTLAILLKRAVLRRLDSKDENSSTSRSRSNYLSTMNVQLSLAETYDDIQPRRLDPTSPSAFVSIMRGCDNLCAFCIVPLTRGRERAKPLTAILEEIDVLVAQGVRDITLLGQNVNSYNDFHQNSDSSTECGKGSIIENGKISGSHSQSDLQLEIKSGSHGSSALDRIQTFPGFKTMYRAKVRGQTTFEDLLDIVSAKYVQVRFRFTSPHPKDMTTSLLQLIASRRNICKQLHLPVQSGHSGVLSSMRRGYSRETYLSLLEAVKRMVPEVSLSSDFIFGFCGETDAAFQDTLSLLDYMPNLDQAYLYMYSERERTHAARTLPDDVPLSLKQQRLATFQAAWQKNLKKRINDWLGTEQVILLDGKAPLKMVQEKRREESPLDNDDTNAMNPMVWRGRSDANKVVLLVSLQDSNDLFSNLPNFQDKFLPTTPPPAFLNYSIGLYVKCRVIAGTPHTLYAVPLSSQSEP